MKTGLFIGVPMAGALIGVIYSGSVDGHGGTASLAGVALVGGSRGAHRNPDGNSRYLDGVGRGRDIPPR